MVGTLLPISKRQAKSPLFSLMYTFRHQVQTVDFTEQKIALSEKTQFKHTRGTTAFQSKSLSLFRGFETIDTWIDFCKAIDNGEYHKVIGSYYRLKRILNR